MNGLQPMPLFEPKADPTNTSARWTQWIQRFNTYLVTSNLKDTARKRALLLYQGGPEVHEIFKTFPDTGDEKNYEAAVNALTAYFEPEKIESIKHICLDKHLNKIMKPSTNFTHS